MHAQNNNKNQIIRKEKQKVKIAHNSGPSITTTNILVFADFFLSTYINTQNIKQKWDVMDIILWPAFFT